MKSNRIDISPEDAITEIAIAMVDLAKDDYIRGALVLIKKFARPMDLVVKHAPAKQMIERSRPGASTAAERKVYWYKDALRFLNEDPYGLFQDVNEIVKAWDEEAWGVYHKKFAKNTPSIIGGD